MSIWLLLTNLIFPQSDKTREFWVKTQLLKLKKNLKILDAGAGECYYKRYCHHLNYIGQDFDLYDGTGDKKGIQTGKRDLSQLDIVSDITDIPVKTDSFGAVLCVEVFEHLPEPLKALKEISRVLEKGGVLLLTTPFSSITHYSPYYFYSGFSPNFFTKSLPLYNFKIEEIYTYGNYFDYLALELVRVPLVCWRMLKFLAIPLFPIYFAATPAYVILRILGIILPSSSNLLAFGVCIKAKKI